MPGLYSHTTRATGSILTAAIYNGDHQNHIDNQTTQMTDDYSSNVEQMQSTASPGGVGTESLPTTLAGEIERLRHVIKTMHGGAQWYPGASSSSVSANGRLSLTSGVPVTTADVSGATSVYFTPHKGNRVEVYDGTVWTLRTFSEMSQATADGTKSPAAVANNSNYDVFVWDDAGVLRATRGPAWASDTARGAGAGTTELEVLEGRTVNKIAITNGPAARRGLYVGSIRSDGSAQINDTEGSVDLIAKRGVWNMYNRVARPWRCATSQDSWTYTGGWRGINGTSGGWLQAIVGLAEDAWEATYSVLVGLTTGQSVAGIGVNSVTAFSGLTAMGTTGASEYTSVSALWSDVLPIGYNYIHPIENGPSGTATFHGDAGSAAIYQSGMMGVTWG